MLADTRPDDPQADALEVSYPLGEIQAGDLYGTRHINSLTTQVLGTRTRRWVEKILINCGLCNSSNLIVVATPSLLHKESDQIRQRVLLQAINQLQRLKQLLNVWPARGDCTNLLI